MSAEDITRALGGQWHGGYGTARCPAHEDRNPSLSLKEGTDGRLLAKCHAGCGFEDILDALRGLGLVDRGQKPQGHPVPRPTPKPTKNNSELALALWAEARDPRDTIVETYLRSRKLQLDADIAGAVLRFHAACPFGPGARLPAMIALYRDLRTDVPVGIHRTALSAAGEKLGRKMLGPVSGAAIKLDANENVTLGLVVAEGIESAMAARMLGFRPCWALGSAGGIGNLPVLPGIEGLTIVGENDSTNAAEARKCAKQWIAADVGVSVLEPLVGNDANDVLRASA